MAKRHGFEDGERATRIARVKWTEKLIAALRGLAEDGLDKRLAAEELADKFNQPITFWAVRRAATTYGITFKPKVNSCGQPFWTHEEDEVLRTCGGLSSKEVIARLKLECGQERTAASISARRKRLGLKQHASVRQYYWTPEEKERLRELAESGHSQTEAARILTDECGRQITREQVAGIASRGRFRFKCFIIRPKPPVLSDLRREQIDAIPPAKLKTDDPIKHKHPVHIRVAARQFLEWRAAQ